MENKLLFNLIYLFECRGLNLNQITEVVKNYIPFEIS